MIPRMVFDVESRGLQGEGFAVAYVVMVGDQEVDSGFAWCRPAHVGGTNEGLAWVEKNVMPHFHESPTHDTAPEVRDFFWRAWRQWAERGAQLWADCGWPVEARFLIECVDDDPAAREWNGPYPLHDIATVVALSGGDPTARETRSPSEPAHHPLHDARVSARQLLRLVSAAT